MQDRDRPYSLFLFLFGFWTEVGVVKRKLALGIAAAGAIVAATAVPALAQVGVYAGPGGFGVELGAPGVYYGDPGYALS